MISHWMVVVVSFYTLASCYCIAANPSTPFLPPHCCHLGIVALTEQDSLLYLLPHLQSYSITAISRGIMATPTSVASSASRDMVQRIHRVTRENRHLWYQLTVLQQPERARACGSGMKGAFSTRQM